MGIFERRLQPVSAREVLPHLVSSSEVLADIPPGGTWYVRGDSWPSYDPVYGGAKSDWFRLDRAMKGSAASLRKHAGGSVLIGSLDDKNFGNIKLNCDHSSEQVSFAYRLEQGKPLEPLYVAAVGIMQYLHGYDESASNQISEQAGQAIETYREEGYQAVRWLMNEGL